MKHRSTKKHCAKRLCSFLLTFSLILSLLPGTVLAAETNEVSPTAQESALQSKELYDGLYYGAETIKNDAGANVNTFVVTVDGSDESLQVVTGVPNDETPLTAGLVQTTSGQAMAAQQNGKNVLAAVNADFFHMGDSTAIQPCSVTIKDGKTLTEYYTENATRSFFFGVKEDGTAVIGDKAVFDEMEDELVQAVGGGPWLVKHGEVEEEWSSDTARHPRTAVGIKEDGSVLLVVADGRTTASAGLSYMELAQYMKNLGAVDALNLDGGGSSAEVVKNPETYALEVKNVPSDGSERPVGNTLLVIDTDSTSVSVNLDKDTDGYYLIKKAADFVEINKAPSADYRLANDIDLTDETVSSVSMLSGELDGNGKTISGLTVNGGNGYALFKSLAADGKIYDLTLEDVSITTKGSAAALALECAGTIENVTVEGSIIGSGQVAGLVGYLSNGGQVIGCSAGVHVTGTSDVGGLVGKMVYGTLIERCYVNANVEGGTRVAGLVGYAVSESTQTDSFIRNCIVRGTVKCTNIEGGGIGGLLKVGVSNCIVEDMVITATGTGAAASGNVAGLLGAWCNGSRPYNGNVIQSGSILAAAQCVAHRIGYHSTNKSNNYVASSVTINGQPETGGINTDNIGADATTEQLTSKNFYEGLDFDFDAVFDWNATRMTPVLRDVDQGVAPSTPVTSAPNLEKAEDGYYLIKTAGDLQEINKGTDANYRLANDLNLTDVEVESMIAFGGDFDGNGKTISNLEASADNSGWALFNMLLSDGCIHDLTLKDVNIRAGGASTAALVGTCNGTVEDVVVTGKIYGAGDTGGIVGALNNGGVIRCCSAGVMVVSTGARVGGIVGFNDGIVEACYANVNVQGTSNVGGIAGYSDKDGDSRAVRNCIVEGSVTAANVEPGGIGGLLKMPASNNIVKNMTVTSTNSTTAVTSGNVAGLLGGWMKHSYGASGNVIQSGNVVTTGIGAGYRLGYNAAVTGAFSNNYAAAAATVNGQAVTGDNNENAADATADQLTSKSFYEGLDFDFEKVFDWDEANKTPVLRNVNQSVVAPGAGVNPGEATVYDVALTIGADETQRNLTWYTDSSKAGEAQLALASAMTGESFPEVYTAFSAKNSESSKIGYYSNQAAVTGLAANTKYVYRVGSDDGWSEVYTFTTGSFDKSSFSFLFAGDPQIGSSGNVGNDVDGWETTLSKANEWFPGTSFLLSAGDQVETYNNETHYDGFLEPELLHSMTLATNIGNHDSKGVNYQEHFALPNAYEKDTDTAAGGDYWFSYNGVLFMSINSNNLSTAEHKAFLQDTIDAYKAENNGAEPAWKIVTFHHSIYSTATHTNDADILQRRADLPQVFSGLGIDAVLMGHDHVYTRSLMMDGATPITTGYTAAGDDAYGAYTASANSGEVLYLTANSASGSKFYPLVNNVAYPFWAKQNQESIPNITRIDVSKDSITFTTYRTGEENNVTDVVDTFTINRPTPTPDEGEINTESAKGLVQYLSSYSTGYTNADGGVAEIVKFNSENDCMYLVSGQTQTLDIVKVKNDGSTELVKKVDIASLGAANGFSAGDITSVDVNTQRNLVAIAVQHSAYDQNGVIVTLDYDGSFVAKYEAGVQPDMVVFSTDGNYILSANEGEPREGYGEGATDPMGSVTVVDLAAGAASTYTFEAFDNSRDQLIADGVLLKKEAAPSADLEPEYIAVSADSKTAYITLQENNAIAALNITDGTWKYVKGLGFKDHSAEGNGLDLNKDDAINIQNEDVYGVYMPDGVAVVTIDGKDYLLTANEGDAREWCDYTNIGKKTVNGSEKVECLLNEETDGLEADKTYLLGARSFSIWDAATLSLVFDSGNDFESITAEEFPTYFNSGHDEAGLDARSRKKGPEPETVAVLETNGKTYAVIGLERMGGIMVYDISAPASAEYADYLNVRNFAQTDLAKAGDLGAEGICTIPAEDSPTGNAMILVANEISGTVTVAQIVNTGDSGDSGSTGSGSGGSSSSSSKPSTSDKTDVQSSFEDVAAGAYYAEAVQWAVENGITQGISKTVFSPNAGCTRAQIVTFLWRAAGSPAPKGTGMPFTDVAATAYYYNAVLWAIENGITMGTTATTFSPNAVCTRAQSVTFLWRALDAKPSDAANPFVDVADHAYYAEAVQWAVENGVTMGTAATTFSPNVNCTRAQIVTFLWRVMVK